MGAADLLRIGTLAGTQNLRVIAPANGAITMDQYIGAGYFQIDQNGTAMGAIITGGLSGGDPASPVPPEEFVQNTPVSVTPAPTQSRRARHLSTTPCRPLPLHGAGNSSSIERRQSCATTSSRKS
jgi:hypothetical protein